MNMTRIATLGGLLALALAAPACSDDSSSGSAGPMVTIDDQGLTPSTFSVTASSSFWIVNADSAPHQIHSRDCQELSTSVIMPGEEREVFVGAGGATCHVEDMLAPLSVKYWGTIEVQAAFTQPSDGA
jgi:hypothetical protein